MQLQGDFENHQPVAFLVKLRQRITAMQDEPENWILSSIDLNGNQEVEEEKIKNYLVLHFNILRNTCTWSKFHVC